MYVWNVTPLRNTFCKRHHKKNLIYMQRFSSHLMEMSHDRLGITVIRLVAGKLRICCFITDRGRYYLLRNVHSVSEAHPSFSVVTSSIFPGDKTVGAWSWLITSCSDFKNERNSTYIALHAFAVNTGRNLLHILLGEKYDSQKWLFTDFQKGGSSDIFEI